MPLTIELSTMNSKQHCSSLLDHIKIDDFLAAKDRVLKEEDMEGDDYMNMFS